MAAVTLPMDDPERFIRRCLDHHEPLLGLTCPLGHSARASRGEFVQPGYGRPPDEDAAWEVFDLVRGLTVARVVGFHVAWARWFVDAIEVEIKPLFERDEHGFTAAAIQRLEIVNQLRRRGNTRGVSGRV